MYKNLITFTFHITLVSCTTLNEKSSGGFASVDLNFNEIHDHSTVLNPKDQVGSYGPVMDEDSSTVATKDKQSLGIVLGPSLYKSIEAIDVLKCFEKLDKKVNTVSGVGFSLIVASLYAQGDSPEQIKWKLFKHLRENKYKPYSARWLNSWSIFVNKNISKKRLLVSNRSLWVPAFDTEMNTIVYSPKGDLKTKIKQNIDHKNMNLPLKKNFLSEASLKNLPVDRIVIINSLSDNIELNNSDGYLYGLYGKIHSVLKNANNSNIVMININTEGALDNHKLSSRQRNLVPICSQLEEVL
jgi:hypothetical protein